MAIVVEDERPVGALFGELASETGVLIKQEMRLARVELGQKATMIARESSFVGAGVLVGVVGLQTLVAAAVLALGLVLAWWAAALIVGGVVLFAAGALTLKGIIKLRRTSLVPGETLASLEDNKSWARQLIQ